MPNDGVSKANKIFDKTIIRNANENTPNVIDNETIRNRKMYTMNHDYALVKITNVNDNRTALSLNYTSTNEHQYSTNKNCIDTMERIAYSRTNIYRIVKTKTRLR